MADQKPSEILLVDSELDDLQLMCTSLRREGHKVFPASGYLAGINTFALHLGRIELLVAAVALPERNGCELARCLLTVDPNLKVLLVSGLTGAEVCHFYGGLGPGVHFLQKPLDDEEFTRLVRLILQPGVPFRTMGAA